MIVMTYVVTKENHINDKYSRLPPLKKINIIINILFEQSQHLFLRGFVLHSLSRASIWCNKEQKNYLYLIPGN